jgi:hypothetical protein
MKIEETKLLLENFIKQCQAACEIAKAAARNKKSLAGDNFYGNKFHNSLVNLSQSQARIKKLLASLNVENTFENRLVNAIDVVKSTNAKSTQRMDALKEIKMICQSDIAPLAESMIANPVPETEQVLAMEVVQGTRPYIERVVMQANGAYEHQWYDACAVMIRRLTETLIIELYEAKKRQSEIQDSDNNYLMLSKLVDKIINDKSWSLGRETKQALPLLKSLGDRSAHNRHYIAKKSDIDKVTHGLRVAVDDFLNLSGLK